MSRRLFLGAAGALSILPTLLGSSASANTGSAHGAADSDVPAVSTSSGEWGHQANVEAGEPVSAWLDLHSLDDVETSISVLGQAYDDNGEDHVEVQLNSDTFSLVTGLSPERAHRLADELRLAAAHTETMGEQ